MNSRSAADAYRSSSIENAPPIKVVRLLYEGALRFLEQACREDPTDPQSHFTRLVGQVDAIVSELRLAIDHSVEAPEITQNLEGLYYFCESELGQATLERSTDRLPGVRSVLQTLLEAWEHVEVEAS